MIRVTFDVRLDTLASTTDAHLHALWHIAQANPAPHGDRDACALAEALTAEIVRRWLQQAPTERFAHQPTDPHWKALVRHGSWRGPGGTWLPHERVTDAPPPT